MKKRWLTLLLLLPFVAGAVQGAETDGGAERFTVTGTVTDLDGRPVEGVSLWAVALAEQRWRDLPSSAVTGPGGAFSISGLPPGRIDLHACGRGYLPARESVRTTDDPAPVRLTIEPGAMVRGRVLDAEGDPLPGARVSAGEWVRHEAELFRPWSPCRPSRIAESDADGRFEIGPLEQGRYDLHVEPPDSALILEDPLPLSIADAADLDVELRLTRHGGRKGSLTDTAGAPVPWAYVLVTPVRGEPQSHQAREDGSFTFFADPGPVTFRVEQEGYEVFEQTIEISVEEAPVALVLARDGNWKTLRGRVTELDDTPVADAQIGLFGADAKARSAADGSFEIQFLAREPSPLVISKEGYSLAVYHVDPENPPAGEIVIHLETGALVTGRLLGLTPADRSPDMRLTLRGVGSLGPEASVQADDTFRFENIPAGTWQLTFHGESRSVARELVVKPGETKVAVEFSLPPPLTGRVTGAEGAPVPGVSLWVVAGPWNLRQPPAPSARSGPDGSFTVPDPPAGRFVLYACGEGFLPWMEPFPSAEETVEVALKPAAALRGRVLGEEGQPLAGTSVGVGSPGASRGWEMPGPCPSQETAVTDEEGRFALGPLPPGRYSLWAITADEKTGGIRGIEAPSGETVEGIEIRVRPSGLLVRVVDPEGRPVSEAEVSVAATNEPPAENLWRAKTAADGSARFVLPAEEGLLVRVERQGFAPATRNEWLDPGERLEVEVRLDPAAAPAATPARTAPPALRLSGRVLDPGGTPLPEVRVEARPEPVVWVRSALSEQDGSFLLADLPPGPFELFFEADGYESQSQRIETASGAMTAPVVLAREDRKECGPRDPENVHDPWEGFLENWKPSAGPADPFFLDSPMPARGKVIGRGGAPVAGARLTQLKGESTATSAADGSFEMSVLAHGWDGITAAGENLAGWRRVEPGGAPVEGLEIQLHPALTISGRVLGLAPGQPDPSEELVLQEREGLVLSTAVSTDGTFRSQIPPGAWRLSVSVSGREASASLTVPPGQTEAQVELRLPALHPVAGQVLDERGQPLAGAQILTWLGGRRMAEISAETGADGRFSLALPDGEHDLHVRKEGYQWGRLEIDVQGAPVTGLSYRAERTALLRGRLLGLPPGDKAIVEIEGMAELQSRTPTQIEVGSGGYSISGLSPGLWRLAARTPFCKLWRTIEIPPGTIEMEMDLDVAPEAPDRGIDGGVTPFTLTGTVTDPEGRPLEGLSLWAVALAEQRGRDLPPSAVTGPDGSFSIPGLPRGEIDLYACGRDYLPVRESVWFTESPVHLQLPPGMMIRGRVLDEEGSPLAGALLSVSESFDLGPGEFPPVPLWSPCPMSGEAESGADGRYEIGPFAPGRYDLQVDLAGFELAPGEPRHLLILDEVPVDPFDVRLKEAPVDLVLERDEEWKTLRGRVTEPDGTPIAEATLLLPGGSEARSAADGSFEIQLLPGEDQEVLIFKEGFSSALLPLDPEALPADEIAIHLEIGARVNGRLLGLAPGDRGPNARLMLKRSGRPDQQASVQADDTFRFENVPPGLWKLAFQGAYRSAYRMLLVKPGQTEVAVDFALPPPIPVSGRVLDDKGHPVAGAEVVAYEDSGRDRIDLTLTREDGSFDVRVPKGEVQLAAYQTGFLNGRLTVSVAGREVKGLEIRLERDGAAP